ncbi:MAG: nucleotidyltransferase domain-containing protein [Candidatus Pacearchaeota archaeon]|jgi:predicted nucleotidyltransferase
MARKLTSKKIIETIKENKNKIREYGVRKIGLFGSYLQNKQTGKSDIDFLVDFSEIRFRNYMALLEFLEKAFRKNVDLVIEKDLKPELKYVKREAEYVKI